MNSLCLRYQVQQDFLEIQAAEQLLNLYAQGIALQSSLTLESSISSYETGGVDFLERTEQLSGGHRR